MTRVRLVLLAAVSAAYAAVPTAGAMTICFNIDLTQSYPPNGTVACAVGEPPGSLDLDDPACVSPVGVSVTGDAVTYSVTTPPVCA